MSNSGALEKALLFIPDISGFTRFVTDTEINHAQHIIQELLDILIQSNQIGLELSEIEGDAILFYRFGKEPTAIELLEQVREMFINFHAHLKKYETHRICHCGACRTAHHLGVKFFAHYGPVTVNRVQDHDQLFGKEVIVIHRLMKNDLNQKEYALFTNDLIEVDSTWETLAEKNKISMAHGRQEYDSGEIEFCHLSLSPLLKEVPEPKREDYSLGEAREELFTASMEIDAPINMVFNVLTDLPFRNQWQEGLDPKWNIDTLNDRITQHGSTHRCLRNGPVLVSHDFEQTEEVIRFTETDKREPICTVFTLKRLNEEHTHFQFSLFMKPNFIFRQFFNLFMKKKIYRQSVTSLENLNEYCKQLVQERKKHRESIVLKNSA